MPLTKQQLEVVNQTNFPNNTTGYISPALLREFNTDIIDNTVNQTLYNTDSSSVSAQLVGLNSYTQSLNTNFITSASLNAATASLSASLTTTILSSDLLHIIDGRFEFQSFAGNCYHSLSC
jgi:hypothetical protein